MRERKLQRGHISINAFLRYLLGFFYAFSIRCVGKKETITRKPSKIDRFSLVMTQLKILYISNTNLL